VAVQKDEEWVPAIKVSDTPAKTINPGHKLVWRLYDRRGKATADLLSLDDEDPGELETISLHHPTQHTKSRTLRQDEVIEIEPLLVDILHDGKLVYTLPDIEGMREWRQTDLERLDIGVKRLVNPHRYHVSLTQRLWDLKQELTRRFQQEGAEEA
jgi:nicotinate phosphoribosyltransferase